MQQQNLANAIYKRLQALAKSKGVSFAELCRQADVSESTYYNIRRKRGMPRIETLIKFCDAADVTLIDFFISTMKAENGGYLTEDEAVLVEFYRGVDSGEKELIKDYAEMIWKKRQK